ncbi:hypothetical protein Tco_0001713 [Tanacetum coccineum]
MPTEMELTLEQTQQGVSYEVSNIRVNSFTMKMEILLEPTSNKLMVEHVEFDESNANVLERFYTSAGNPVKEILLKLNLPDHRILKDGSEEEAATMPHDSPLLRVHSLRSDEGSMTLHELTVKKLEHRIKSIKSRRRVRLIISKDEDDLVDPSKLGKKIAQLDEDEGITLVQMGAQTQGHEHDLEPNFEFTALEEVYTAEPDISTANVPVSTAGAEVSTASPKVKTVAESLVYIKRSAAERKDKGKAIIKEAEPV